MNTDFKSFEKRGIHLGVSSSIAGKSFQYPWEEGSEKMFTVIPRKIERSKIIVEVDGELFAIGAVFMNGIINY